MKGIIRIEDYFRKHGFEDGDNRPLVDLAEWVRESVVALLNAEFIRRGLPYRAIPYDIATLHNPVRMCLQWEREGWIYRWDIDDKRRNKITRFRYYEIQQIDCVHPRDVEVVFSEVQKAIDNL